MKNLLFYTILSLTLTFPVMAAGCQSLFGPKNVALTTDGKSGYVIVTPDSPNSAEAYAAAELADFIQRITSASIPVKSEGEFKGTKAIQVGPTHFAEKNGIDSSKLGGEEWAMKVVGNDLIITGGRPRGTLYGVYEFLETVAGVRFLTAQNTHVPNNPTLTVPGDLSIRGEPAFERREIYMVLNGHGPEDQTAFQVRRKINSFSNAARQIDGKYGSALMFGSPYSTHTHHRYVADFPEAFKGHPEYFALTNRNVRQYPKRYFDAIEKGEKPRPPHGQVCMSHPEVRRIFTEKLCEYIERDRDKIRKAGTKAAFPTLYSLNPDDGTSGKCFCERCMKLAEKHGSYAGVTLDFTNAIADAIAEDYPDVKLTTGAYQYYRNIPKDIRPTDNVVVYMAQLGARYNTLPKRDRTRNFFHPLNRAPREEWEAWSKICPVMGVHDYWNHENVRALASNLKFYHDHGVRQIIPENILLGSRVHNFADLEFYLASKLMQDPELDEEAVIDEYMTLAYRDAAPVMKRLLAYLERRREEETNYIASVPARARKYLDADYFIETDAMLAEAEKLVEDDARQFADVRQERISLDKTMLYLWDKLSKEAGDRWPFKRDEVFQRLKDNYQYVYGKYGGWGPRLKEKDDLELEYIKNMPPIPDQFAGREVIDLCGPKLRLTRGGREPKTPVPDSDAATGKTWRLGSSLKGETREGMAGNHVKLPKFGLSDCVSKPKFLVKRVLEKDGIPKDEKYHWHYVGRMQATPSMYFFGHHSWAFDQRLYAAYNAALPDQDFYDVYVSLKLEGPAYAPGSKKENAFSIDRIIMAKVDPDELKKEK